MKTNRNPLPAIEYGRAPKVLLLGNGINRSFNANSWDSLIDNLSCGKYGKAKQKLVSSMPYPLQAVIASEDCVNEGCELLAKELVKVEVEEEQSSILNNLLNQGFDAVLTTNYTYDVEKAVCPGFQVGFQKRSKYRITTFKGNTADEQYGLFKCMMLDNDCGAMPVWHIHGEAARPNSMVLGHYYYGNLLGRIQQRASEIIRRYEGCKKYKRSFQPHSWVDYFLIGDVYIVGLGMDFFEMDLWWLVNCKRRHSDIFPGKVKWFEPNLDTDKCFAKKELAELYSITTRSETVKGDEGYKAYYRNLQCLKESNV